MSGQKGQHTGMNAEIQKAASSLYSEKGGDYFSKTRNSVIALLPDGPNKVMEIGCGFGKTLIEAKRRGKASELVGVDIKDSPLSGELDAFITGKIETVSLPFPHGYFDAIILADVLEHLDDPWSTLKNVLFFLKPGGVCVISIPNIRELRTIAGILLRGRFEYQELGILDKTHIRFFCKKDIVQLIVEADLEIEVINFGLSPKRSFFNRVTLRFFEDFLVQQYVIRSRKKH